MSESASSVSVPLRSGRKTACSTDLGQKSGALTVAASKYERKMGGASSGT